MNNRMVLPKFLLIPILCYSFSLSAASRPLLSNADEFDQYSWLHWADYNDDCIDERYELLIKESEVPVTMDSTGCKVETGYWITEISQKTLTDVANIEVVHVVPLNWVDRFYKHETPQFQERLANWPINMMIVEKGFHIERNDLAPYDWIPGGGSTEKCRYLTRWQAVLEVYTSIVFDPNENQAFQDMLTECKSK